MKRCSDAVPLLSPLSDGALPDDDRAWVEEHLGECGRCQDRLAIVRAQAQALRERLAARVQSADFSGFAARVLARIRQDERPSAIDRLRVWASEMWMVRRGTLAATSGLALAACLALGVFLAPEREPAPTMVADASVQLEQVDFGTHDGAVLQLPHDTTVIWISEDRDGVPQ